MKLAIVLFCYTVFCYVTFYIIGYESSKLDTHLRVLENKYTLRTLRYTCSELMEYNPDYSEVELGMKAFCYEYEQSKK
jgi:hypothetical protein